MGKSLLDKIESEALNGDVVKALRLCITLGGHSDSAELRDWAARELRGYEGDDELADYRIIRAPLCIDHSSATGIMTGQQISAYDLPEFVRDSISEELELSHSIPELLNIANSAERKGESVSLLPDGSSRLARVHERQRALPHASSQSVLAGCASVD